MKPWPATAARASSRLRGAPPAGEPHGLRRVRPPRAGCDSALAEPWTARRKRLEDLLETPPPGVCLVPVTDDAPALWDTWVGMGGEGIVLKERSSVYRPNVRSPAWLKLKPKLTLEVVVTSGSTERIRWGDWGEALVLAFRYTHPRTGADVEIRQAVRVPRDLAFDFTIGARLALVCWGVMPSGMLRHPVFLRTESS